MSRRLSVDGTTWQIYPAIDLRQGRVVRLMQGDPDRETAYASDPVAVARRWQQAGAEWVHIVNLDGALGEGGRENLIALERILSGSRASFEPCPGGSSRGASPGLRVQFGGGLRDLASIRRALDLGVERVVLGTAAVRDPSLVEAALDAFGARRVAVGIDARHGKVQTHGWREGADVTALELAQHWASRGLRWLIFTDVARDGMGRGLNLQATVRIADATGLNVIASGGVAHLDDVRRAYQANLRGVIIGRALYEGDVTLADALRVTRAEPQRPMRHRRPDRGVASASDLPGSAGGHEPGARDAQQGDRRPEPGGRGAQPGDRRSEPGGRDARPGERRPEPGARSAQPGDSHPKPVEG